MPPPTGGLRGGSTVRTQGIERHALPPMAKTLVIVESPAKAKTIKKYLGAGYEVVASKGHVKDLVKKDGVDVKNGFEERYEIIDTKAKVLAELKAESKKADVLL